MLLFSTIPAIVASRERSFSKLKLFNNYLRSIAGQERLSSFISFENVAARNVDVLNFINVFAICEHEVQKKGFSTSNL